MRSAIQQYIMVNPYSEMISGITLILSISGGIVKISGRPGTGKTALFHELQKEFKSEKTEFISFETAPETPEELISAICRKLKLDTNADFIQTLTRHLIAKPFSQQQLVIIIDEAEKLSDALLNQLVDLRHIALNDQSLVNMVLLGGSDLDKLLDQPELNSFKSSIVLNYELEPLNKEQLADFCKTYLSEMRLEEYQFTDEDINALLESSSGFPGALPDLIPGFMDQDSSKKLVRTKKQKEFVAKATQTLTHEFVDPLIDSETQTEVLSRWKGPLGKSTVAAGLAVALFIGYAAFVFIPAPIFPLGGVSYFNDDAVEQVADTAIPDTAPVTEPVVEEIVEEAIAGIATELETEEPPVASEQDNEEALPLTEAEPEVEVATIETPAPATLPDTPDQIVTTTPVQQPAAIPTPATPVQTPAPVPVTTPATTAANTGSNDAESQAQALLNSWIEAWQEQNVDGYFAAYHPEFSPPGQRTLESWMNQRSRNINRPSSIQIQYEDLNIIETDGDTATIQFWMNYQSPTYADRTLKEIALVADNQGNWKILQEENLQVDKLAVNRSTPGASRLQVMLESPVMLSQSNDPAVQQLPGQTPANLAAEEAELFGFVNDWLLAWQNQDINRYFTHYRENYKPSRFTSITEWQQDRITKISRPNYIELNMENFEIVESNLRGDIVSFDLEYRTVYYADRTRKELLIAREPDGKTVIAVERNRAVETLPIYRRRVAGNEVPAPDYVVVSQP